MSPEELKTLSKILPLIIVVILIVCGKDLLSILRYTTHLIKTNPLFRFISGILLITLISNSIYYYLKFLDIKLHFLFDVPLYLISFTTLILTVVILYGYVFFGILYFIKIFIPSLNPFEFFEKFHGYIEGICILIAVIFFTINKRY